MLINAHMGNLLNISPVKNSNDILGLRRFYDKAEVQIRSLESLGITSETYGSLLCPILLKLVPSEFALEFSRSHDTDVNWNLKELMVFLRKEIESRERASTIVYKPDNTFSSAKLEQDRNKPFNFKNKTIHRQNKASSAAELMSASKREACIFCNDESHISESCGFKNVDYRKDILKRTGRCFLCLGRHIARNCPVKGLCTFCDGKHSKAICYKSQMSKTNLAKGYTKQKVEIKDKEPEEAIFNGVSHSLNNKEVFLQTAVAEIEGKGLNETIRCLFDLGSQRSFITKDLVDLLSLTVVGKETLKIHTFQAKAPTQQICRRVKVRLRNIHNGAEVEIEALETNEVSNVLLSLPEGEIRNKLESKGLVLADFKFKNGCKNAKISLLIGADNYWKMVSGRIERIKPSLVALDTVLGWCLCGSSGSAVIKDTSVNLMVDESVISDQIKQFWELENLGVGIPETEEITFSDDEVMEFFESTVKYENNRYKVKLPWKPDVKHLLKDNKNIAKERHKKLVNKFRNDPLLFSEYQKVINDYLKEGIIEPIPEIKDIDIEVPEFYLPHRAVIRKDKTTSKLRIVFDASCHARGELSLNNCLHTGPNLNPNILDLLLRFRENSVAFTADVKQAFLNIDLDEGDRDVARFFWTDNPFNMSESKGPEVLRLTKVLFGMNCSPFLLAATIKHHLKGFKEQYPETCRILDESLYVDDLISSREDINQAFNTSLESVEIFRQAGMTLRKWQTNSKELQDRWVQAGIHQNNSAEIITQDVLTFKVLGIAWDTESDNFYFDTVKLMDFLSRRNDTKRFVLQVVGRIFDPVGFLSPFTIRIKCLLQEIWSLGIGWDDDLPDHLKPKWSEWCEEVGELDKISIPRYYLKDAIYESIQWLELHCFSDASIAAYGTVLYLRITTDTGKIFTTFVSSKSRVAPLKSISLPRLELMGALLSARLSHKIAKILKYDVSCYFWTDSTITFYWITGIPSRFKPFIKNRVEEIQKLTQPSAWSHCSGKDNPADLLSRGMKVSDLINNRLFWHGPPWLQQPKESWPKTKEPLPENRNLELQKKFQDVIRYDCTLHNEEKLIDINRFSSLLKVLRITSWIRRFIMNCRQSIKCKGPLTAQELQEAEEFWIKDTQREFYSSEIQSLNKNGHVGKQSTLHSLAPFIDDNNILRIGGRLEQAEFTPDEKHPILLPRNSRLTELLVEKGHIKVMHSGVAATLMTIRSRFWIPKGRQLVKRIIKGCIICRKYLAKPASQITSQLPRDRIQETPPFFVCGIDFAGPIYIKGDSGNEKSYIALFTCATTRALHLELVSNMTTENFLLALRRFISRRGVCHTIYSDNAKSFKSTERELNRIAELFQDQKVQDFVSKEGIRWKYIIERAGWWGGFYERMVKSVKECLRKILGRALLTFEELTTLLAEIESVLNLRPLSYMYSDTGEPEPLTPSHFLYFGRSNSNFTQFFDPEVLIKASSRLHLTKRKQYQMQLLKQVWHKWKSQYLMELRTAHHLTNTEKQKEIQPGDIMLVEGVNKSKFLWDLGIVTEVLRGRDGYIRSCVLRTAKTPALRRPVQLLYPLEITEANNSNISRGPQDVK